METTKKKKVKVAAPKEEEHGEEKYSFWPTQKGGRLMPGVGYEKFHFCRAFDGRWKEDPMRKDSSLEGEYEVYYICFDAFAQRYYQQEGRYEEENLELHRTVKGTLTLSFENDHLVGSIQYDEKTKGCLVPSNGFFTFEQNDAKQDSDRIKCDVKEYFFWPGVGTNTTPRCEVSRVRQGGPLGIDDDKVIDYKVPHFYPDCHRKIQYVVTGMNYTPDGCAEAAQTYIDEYNDIPSSWISNHLSFPGPVVKLVRSFLYPPPFLYVKEGDLVLETTWDNRTNTTYTLARRKEGS